MFCYFSFQLKSLLVLPGAASRTVAVGGLQVALRCKKEEEQKRYGENQRWQTQAEKKGIIETEGAELMRRCRYETAGTGGKQGG